MYIDWYCLFTYFSGKIGISLVELLLYVEVQTHRAYGICD